MANTDSTWNPERAGRIVLHDLCKGDKQAAIKLLTDTLNECERQDVLTSTGAAQVIKMINWVAEQR